MSALRNFVLPDSIVGSPTDIQLGRAMVEAWRTDGIFEVRLTSSQDQVAERAIQDSKRFFRKPLREKSRLVSDLTYSGYVACGEEWTAGEADCSEIFTVCKDVPLDDPRVVNRWPCHGPTPWPDEEFKVSMVAFMEETGRIGQALLELTALGFGLDIHALSELTDDGWHHMRVLRFQQAMADTARGIGAHTDYGLLVIAVQRDADGLDIRPPVNASGKRERRRKNWIPGQSTAGEYENDPHWLRVPLVPGVVTVFPGDLLQYITGDYLISTPHKVELHRDSERFALAYFHEPNFARSLRPHIGTNEPPSLLYGKHFTDMFMRSYPERPVTTRIQREHRYQVLETIRREGEARN